MNYNVNIDTAIFGGGCFWCVKAVFSSLKGVLEAESGYSGGNIPNPTYEQVCKGNTGHAEVCRVVFDREIISYETLVTVFMASHDPTTRNRQGDDIGTQYRSVIFYNDGGQKQTALKVIRKMEAEKIFEQPIVTEVAPLMSFYPAELYHQDYFENNPTQPYCAVVINPKVSKIKKDFAPLLK